MRNTFVRCLTELAANNKNVILVTGDLGYGVLNKFWDVLPDQFFNAGISEQNMTGFAAGLAMEGKTVFTYSIANFPTIRCLEQVRNDVAYNKANVKIVAVGGGMSYGQHGMTHHATEDVAIMRAIPNMTVLVPGDPYETEACTKYACETNGAFYIRLGKGGEENIHKAPLSFDAPKVLELESGGEVAILACGAILSEAKKAHTILGENGIKAGLYSVPFVKPIDKNAITELARSYKAIVTVEEHNISGGFGSAVSEIISQNSGVVRFKIIGLNDVFTSQVGTQQYLRDFYKISAPYIADTVKSLLI